MRSISLESEVAHCELFLSRKVDGKKINAKVEQGILTLTLPKAEHVKPKKIVVS